jgi:hypothetical protein
MRKLPTSGGMLKRIMTTQRLFLMYVPTIPLHKVSHPGMRTKPKAGNAAASTFQEESEEN